MAGYKVSFEKINKGNKIAVARVDDGVLWVDFTIIRGQYGPFITAPNVRPMDSKEWIPVAGISNDPDKSRFKKLSKWVLDQAEKEGVLKQAEAEPIPQPVQTYSAIPPNMETVDDLPF